MPDRGIFVDIRPGESWGYIATCPDVGGVYVEAATVAEAERLALEAAEAVIESRKRP